MKETLKLIKQDIINYYKGIILAILSLFLLNSIFHEVCLGKIFFGIPCPACGITRAFFLLLQGKWKESIQMHPLLLPLLLFCFYLGFIKYFLKKSLHNINSYVIIWICLSFGVYIWRFPKLFPNIEPMKYYKENFLQFFLCFIKKLQN